MNQTIPASEMKQLIQAQQGELDAVVVYRELAKLFDHQEQKERLLAIAKDEGKHARILKEYTKTTLKPKSGKAKIVLFLYRFLGQRRAFRILMKGEKKAGKQYSLLVDKYPLIETIMNDEDRHAVFLSEFL